MALDFTGGDTDHVDHGADASISDLHTNPFSILMWVRRDANGSNQWLASTSSNGGQGSGWSLSVEGVDGPNGNIQFRIGRATTNTNYITSSVVCPLNAWALVAVTYDEALADEIDIYGGSPTVDATEATYDQETDGSGAEGADPNNVIVGNINTTNSFSFAGRIAWIGIYTRRLTLDEIIRYQYRPPVDPDCALFCHYGWNDTGTQPDLSGNGNNGTVTGATVADHPGIYPASGEEDSLIWVPPAVVADENIHTRFHRHALQEIF